MFTRQQVLRAVGWAGAGALVSRLQAFAQGGGGAGALRAGVAKVKITPTAATLAAYGAADPGRSGGVEEDIYARLIVLANGVGQKMLLASLELNGLPAYDALTAAIARSHGIDKAACFLCSADNHQAPDLSRTGPAVAQAETEITAAILAGVGQAVAALKPARMAFAKGTSDINVHFGRQTPAGFALTPDFARDVDKELSLLRIDDLTGKTLALFVNYGMQSNAMGPASKRISGDMAGKISTWVERRLQCVCAWSVSAAADVYPLNIGKVENFAYTADGKATIDRQTLSEEITGKLGDYLATVQGMDIQALYDQMARFSDRFSVRFATAAVAGPGRKGQVAHRLHLAVINNDIAIAAANAVVSPALGRTVKASLPYRTIFTGSEGPVVGVVVDSTAQPTDLGAREAVTADPWATERLYVEGFRKLATTQART